MSVQNFIVNIFSTSTDANKITYSTADSLKFHGALVSLLHSPVRCGKKNVADCTLTENEILVKRIGYPLILTAESY